jgi:hypothetical protein
MTKYLQTNEHGYVVSITSEPVLMSLFGGSPRDYRELTDDEAERIQKLLKACHSKGEGLHINDVVEFKPSRD